MQNKNFIKFSVFLITALVLMLPMGIAFAQDDSGGGFNPVYCIGGIVSIALAFWTYQDANKRGGNGILWGIVVFIFGLIGLLAYWFLGRPKN